ncbi:hypothetical protein A3840_15290 [Devosia elaeis]|uniref:Uncharacterized protein n=1 Tax=Devosia elaeis TaxID=1770058 RepID=A0A178HQM0_9HYPH|nr:hypothetical protein A3840_15290 [Devosia elaeis]
MTLHWQDLWIERRRSRDSRVPVFFVRRQRLYSSGMRLPINPRGRIAGRKGLVAGLVDRVVCFSPSGAAQAMLTVLWRAPR